MTRGTLNMRDLTEVAALSRWFGSNPEYVFLGGGNTSFKTDDMLYIKPSGTTLATIQPEDFIAVDRASLQHVFTADLPEDVWEREAAVKEIMMLAVRPIGSGRPSVESPVHDVIEFPYVFHLHPTMVNGFTCAADGEAACAELFPEALWIEFVKPGYTLSTVFTERLAVAKKERGCQPKVVFLQNHGVFVGADTLEEIRAIYEDMMKTLRRTYAAAGVPLELATGELEAEAVAGAAPPLRTILGTDEDRAIVSSAPPFAVAEGPFTPDHIVYAKSFALVDDPTAVGVASFTEERGYAPKVVSLSGKAVLAADTTLKGARETIEVARDAARVGALTAAFGGPRFLPEDDYAFIENWEVESYRKKIAAAASGGASRLANRVCVVTGAAQGFGLGIAQGLAEAGGTIVFADLNIDGAQQAAADLNATQGKDRALAVQVNIADEASVQTMVQTVVEQCGGLDLLVANAGVLKAGPVSEFSLKDWEFVTSVNYTGYFLCVKYAAPVMGAQVIDTDSPWTDIVQINSKSGLEGSNKNAAYAGSKFGTLGLTQSFAKELVSERIKVNSICPGNYFDGPLWSDPQRGLFMQYLETGKVPGAKTVEDVRRSYEEKTPIQRGCTPADVVKAILYAVDQDYETGQAIPVTGGQVMLK
mgnify:CR=1 FL=1